MRRLVLWGFVLWAARPLCAQPGTVRPVPQDPARTAPQEPEPQPTPGVPPPGERQQPQNPPQGEVVVDERVKRLEGRIVRAIRVWLGGRELQAADEAGERIVRDLKTRAGQPLELRHIALDCQNLWNERRMAVHVHGIEDGDQVIVEFRIEQEVQVYERVEFQGMRHVQREEADQLLGLYTDRQVTRTEAIAMRNVLTAKYRRDGFAFCSIELIDRDLGPAEAGDRARKVLVFRFDEGPRVKVRSLRFRGNRSFPGEPSLGWFGGGDYLVRDSSIQSGPGVFSSEPFSREVFEEDLDRLRLFYRSRGFLDAVVELADTKFSEDRTRVDLDVLVVEGPRYKIRSLKVVHADQKGARLPPGQSRYTAAEIGAEIKCRPGDFYDFALLRRDWQAIQDFYGKRGHPSVLFPGMRNVPEAFEVAWPPAEVYSENDEVDVTFSIREGRPKALREVLIRGNTGTRDAVIRRKIYALPGDRIDMTAVDRSIRYLSQTRFFQDPETLQGPRFELLAVEGRDDQLDLAIDLEEGETGEFRWGIGISTGAGAQATLQFNKRNFDLFDLPSSPNPFTVIGEVVDNRAFHGGGQQLDLLLAPGTEISQFQIGYTEPDLFGQHFDTWELRVNGRRRIRRFTGLYTTDTLGADLGLSHFFTEEFSAGVAVRQESVEVDEIAPDAPTIVWDAEGQTELRGLRLSARWRDLDDFRRPSSGFDLTASAEMIGGPLGGEESLWKLTHGANVHLPLWENAAGHKYVLRLEHFFGWGIAFDDSNDVFLTERFYMGAVNLRGFEFRGAGPSQFGHPIGGEAIYTATIELNCPLVATRLDREVRDREVLRWILFTDIGFLGTAIDDPSFREMRAASGVGLRIEVPVLEIPIALDLGWPWMREETDEMRQFYFSISR